MISTPQTQPEPEHISRAAAVLEAILLNDDLPVQERLAVGTALATLTDVWPPYEPGPQPTTAIDVASGIRLALAELRLAIRAATSVQDAVRVGLAGRHLQPLHDRVSQPDPPERPSRP